MIQARDEYINELSDEYGIDEELIWALADILGENEDHDGLISALEDLVI